MSAPASAASSPRAGELSPSERDNLTIWTPGRRGFYEVYYLKLNDPAARFALWLRYTILAPARPDAPPVAEVWAIAFDPAGGAHAAAKETFPVADLATGRARFSIRIGASELRHDGAEGKVAGPSGSIAWRLAWTPGADGFRPFPYEAMYTGPFPKTKMLSPNVDVRMSGEVTVNGRTVVLGDAPGMQAHLYGTRHAASWVWCHVNAWDGGRDGWIEGVTARVGLGPVPLPPLTVFGLVLHGERRLFHAPAELVRDNRVVAAEPAFTFACGDDRWKVEGLVTAPAGHFVGVRYEDPDGSYRICRNTKVATCRLRVFAADGAGLRLEDELTSSAAALEFVDAAGHPAVPVRI